MLYRIFLIKTIASPEDVCTPSFVRIRLRCVVCFLWWRNSSSRIARHGITEIGGIEAVPCARHTLAIKVGVLGTIATRNFIVSTRITSIDCTFIVMIGLSFRAKDLGGFCNLSCCRTVRFNDSNAASRTFSGITGKYTSTATALQFGRAIATIVIEDISLIIRTATIEAVFTRVERILIVHIARRGILSLIRMQRGSCLVGGTKTIVIVGVGRKGRFQQFGWWDAVEGCACLGVTRQNASRHVAVAFEVRTAFGTIGAATGITIVTFVVIE
mmetsp:Transcript_23016/g.38046  ORF Transcript_23016/g.38046 Transcript_23016/m.38046 type:complete len:271 (+) Transcript_23016:41-853(+)